MALAKKFRLWKKKEKEKKKKLLDNIKTLVGSAIQRKWPEKRPGALWQRNKIKGWLMT